MFNFSKQESKTIAILKVSVDYELHHENVWQLVK